MPKIEPTGSPPLPDEQSNILPVEKTTETANQETPIEPITETELIPPSQEAELVDHESPKVDEAPDTADKTDKKPGLGIKIKAVFALWWANKKLRYITLGGAAVILIALLALPPSRYFI